MAQKHLTQPHREIIERFPGKKSIRSIAVLLGYSPAAISKEVRRNADKMADTMRRPPKEGPIGVPQKTRRRESGRPFLPTMCRKD